MSEREPRDEAAALARGLRRYLEREAALGGAELLVRSARAAGSLAPVSGARAPKPVTQGAAAPVSPGASKPMTQGAAAPVSPGALKPMSPTSPVPVSLGSVAPGLPGAPMSTSAPSLAPATDLFGQPLPDLRGPNPGSIEPMPLHPPLNPFGLEAREAIVTAGLPTLEMVAVEVRGCRKCGLCEGRTQAVPGVGSAASGIVFVGEAPGAEEDRLGEPFVGRAGQLLDRIIKAMDDARLIPDVPLSRQTVYICNVLKCRPPENRNPLPHEVETCSPYLRRQLDALKPKIICCLGKFAAELLVGVKGTIGGLRGRVYRYQGAKLIVTYHPAALLRNPAYKRPLWEDMQLLAREIQTP